jgi:hypothetical protein
MPPRFHPGAAAYAKDGRRYEVAEVEDGIVYCRSAAGAETEFDETLLFNEAEWLARTGAQPDRLRSAIQQAKAFAPYRGKLTLAAASRLLDKAERLAPGILDYTAFVCAERALAEAGQTTAAIDLPISKCREIFDAASPESRTAMLAGLIGSPPEVLAGAADLGDNLLKAMIGKAATAGSVPFEDFRDRRRR